MLLRNTLHPYALERNTGRPRVAGVFRNKHERCPKLQHNHPLHPGEWEKVVTNGPVKREGQKEKVYHHRSTRLNPISLTREEPRTCLFLSSG
ncbi:hypothetical protein NPIL_219421, partial [Nephila pilipes]